MALFALSGGRIVPAQAVELDGTSATEVLGALRERALDIVGVPLFPIVWEQADRQPGESHLLTMDSAGNTVIVSIRAHFSAVSLFEALSLAGRYSSMSRREIVAMYPGGQAAFDSAWQTFRESSPATASAGARMVVVTLRADDDLFPVITTLSEGVRVLEARVYGSGTQRYLSVDTCHKRAVNSTTDARTVAPRPAAAPAAAGDLPAGPAPVAPRAAAGRSRVPAHVHLDRSRPLVRVEESATPEQAGDDRRMDSGPVETGDKRRRRSRPRESHVSAPREATAPRSLGNSPLGNSAAALPEPGRAAPSNGGPGRGREGRRAAKLTPVSPASAPSAPQTSASSAPQASSSPAAAPARPAFDSSKIPVIPAWRLENEKERDTPNYIYAMRQQQVTRVRTEQLLWEKSAPKRDSSAGRAEANSESMAASASEDAVKRAAEREILSPAGRLLAIASRNRTPLSLSIEREGARPAAAKLTAWGTLIVGRASFTDPSQAASEALGGIEVDGWRAWTASDGRSLDDL